MKIANFTLLRENVSHDVHAKNAQHRKGNQNQQLRYHRKRTTGRPFRRNNTRTIYEKMMMTTTRKRAYANDNYATAPIKKRRNLLELTSSTPATRTDAEEEEAAQITAFQEHVQAMAVVLFEEDYICFGYPLPSDIPDNVRQVDRVYTDHQRTVHRSPPQCSKRYILPEN